MKAQFYVFLLVGSSHETLCNNTNPPYCILQLHSATRLNFFKGGKAFYCFLFCCCYRCTVCRWLRCSFSFSGFFFLFFRALRSLFLDEQMFGNALVMCTSFSDIRGFFVSPFFFFSSFFRESIRCFPRLAP